jgi:hypothetical protein
MRRPFIVEKGSCPYISVFLSKSKKWGGKILKSMVNSDLSWKKFSLILGMLLIMLLAMSTGLMAGTYSGGDGNSGTPYQIADLDDLGELSTTSADWATGIYFIQTADIDASATSGWNGGAGFSPIGNNSNKFSGNYNGQNHSIDQLTINEQSDYNKRIGFFGWTSGATIQNLNLTNVNITGVQYIGGLVGQLRGASNVDNCFTSGTVTSVAGPSWLHDSSCGGLFGYTNDASTVDDSHSSCSIIGQRYIGGLAGQLRNTTMSNCYSTGNVTSNYADSKAGGLVGYTNDGAIIQECYTSGNVDGNQYSGGLIGQQYNSTISRSYSIGTVNGTNNIGGFVGYADASASISNCYSKGDVTRKSGETGTVIGAFCGRQGGCTIENSYTIGSVYYTDASAPTDKGFISSLSGTTTNNFFDSEASNQTTGNGATGKTTAQMKTLSTFTDAGWDFTTPIWRIDGTNNDGYPYLSWESYPPTPPTVTTQAVSSIAATTATGNGNITDLGAPNPTQHGVCWSISVNATTSGSHTEEGAAVATGAFTTSMTGLLAATDYYVRAYATNEAGTAYGNEVNFKTNEDGTGVLPDVQDAGPNEGDGNGDGIKDSKQTTVASLPSATPSEGYLTVEITDCDQIEQVQAHTYESVVTSDPGYSYPFGLLGFEIPCASATVRIYYHGAGSLGGFTYRKYGPTPADWVTSLWYTMPGVTFGTKVIGGETVPYAEFDLTESELGDDTNGSPIIDQGGPARPGGPATVPTLNEWGMIILSLLMAVSAFIVIRRRQQA